MVSGVGVVAPLESIRIGDRMTRQDGIEHVDTLVIGGGQTGLAVGYHLLRQGLQFLIVDANERVGDSWRNRWDSLRLFTPSRFDGLPGLPFSAPRHSFPSKDEMADYLEGYAQHFDLPIRHGVKVDRLSRNGGRFVVTAGNQELDADNVVVAMATWQRPRIPLCASELDPGLTQIHSIDYRNPSQLQEGGVLIVGAGNSGAEIAVEVASHHPVFLSGPDTGHIPFRVDAIAARIPNLFILRFVFHRVLTTSTPIGRRVRAKAMNTGSPLIRVKPNDLFKAGVERIPRITGVEGGLPQADDGRLIAIKNVIWCTGYHPGFSWIDLPGVGDGHLDHDRGVVASQPGLYFVGLHFLHALSSGQIHGMVRDAKYVVEMIAARLKEQTGPAGITAAGPA
jgi:putative flavoprotein involved in K+ transport